MAFTFTETVQASISKPFYWERELVVAPISSAKKYGNSWL